MTIKRLTRGKKIFGKRKKRQRYKTVYIVYVNEFSAFPASYNLKPLCPFFQEVRTSRLPATVNNIIEAPISLKQPSIKRGDC